MQLGPIRHALHLCANTLTGAVNRPSPECSIMRREAGDYWH